MPSIGTHLLSGALSGLASTVFLQPFDLLKTRQQQLHPSPSPSPSSTVTATRQRPPNVPALARAVLAAEGPRGLWRGTAASLARNVPGIAMYMAGLTHLRALMARTTAFRAAPAHSSSSASAITTLPTLSPAGNVLAGAATRVAVGFVLNPISVLKARYESSLHTLPSLPSALLSLFKAGPRELTRGFAASAVRDAPYAGLFVVSYEGIKRRMGEVGGGVGLHSSVVHTTSAAVAGTFATLATHPFDVIKTKIQVRSEAQYRGLLGTVSTILQTRGVAGFFDGASLRLSRKVLSSAIGWGVYEGVLIMSRRL